MVVFRYQILSSEITFKGMMASICAGTLVYAGFLYAFSRQIYLDIKMIIIEIVSKKQQKNLFKKVVESNVGS